MHCVALYQLKGGVGKTSAAVNLAAMAAADGWPTLLWDLDAQGAAGYVLGLDEARIKTGKLLRGEQPAGRLVEHTAWPRLDVIPGALKLRQLDARLPQEAGGRKWLKRSVAAFGEDYRLVILDCPPTIGPLADSIFEAAELLLMPTLPGPLAQRAVDQVRRHLDDRSATAPRLRPFFSMVDRRRQLHRLVAERPARHLRDASPITIPNAAIIERMGLERAPLTAFAPPRDIALQSYQALWHDLRRQLSAA